MKTYAFTPNFEVVEKVGGYATIKTLERERGVYSATPEFVREHCGPIANSILDAVPASYFAEAKELGLYPNVDVRIHRLYPGDFPAYPGWHCDGEYRETYFSQPDLDRIKVSRHVTCTVSSEKEGVCCPRFLDEPFECLVGEVDQESTLWGQVDASLRRYPSLEVADTSDGELVMFDSWSLHRALPARVRGWRLFFRMAMWHKPNLGEGGMLTKQEQVYKLLEGSGW